MKRDSANPYFMSLWLYDRFTKADSDKFFLSANNRSPEKICSEPAIYTYIGKSALFFLGKRLLADKKNKADFPFTVYRSITKEF